VRNEYTPFCNGRGRGPSVLPFSSARAGWAGLAGFDENAAIRFQDQSVTLSICKWEENPYEQSRDKTSDS
jgi:hypothetical protein